MGVPVRISRGEGEPLAEAKPPPYDILRDIII
jgi:hypothetical protein